MPKPFTKNLHGLKPSLITWKHFALIAPVRFSGLPRAEAGLREAPCGLVRRYHAQNLLQLRNNLRWTLQLMLPHVDNTPAHLPQLTRHKLISIFISVILQKYIDYISAPKLLCLDIESSNLAKSISFYVIPSRHVAKRDHLPLLKCLRGLE